MGVVNILLPNLAVDQALIDSTIASIEAAASDNLYTFLNPRFILKSSSDCSTFYFDDETDYNEVDIIDPVDVSINVSFVYRSECGDVVVCSSKPMSNNGRLEFQNEMGDGEYCCIVDIEYIDPLDSNNTYSDRLEYCIIQKCCNNNINTLRNSISSSMAKISCTINSLNKIGRNSTQLSNNYLKMSNMLWLIDHTENDCRTYSVLSCLYKSI